MTQEYSATPPAHVPPAQWGEFYGRASEEGCELFGAVPAEEDDEDLSLQAAVNPPDELHDAHSPIAPLHQAPLVAARCVNGSILRPSNTEDDHPSTACQHSEVHAPGGVPLGRGTPGQQQSPGGRRGRDIEPPPPPPPPPVPHASAVPSATTYPMQWTPLHTRAKAAGGGGPPAGPPNPGSGSSQWSLPGSNPSGGGTGSGGGAGSGGAGPPPPPPPPPSGGGSPGGGSGAGSMPRGTPPQQSGGGAGEGLHHLHLQASHNLHAHRIHGVHLIDPGKLCRSSCYRPTTRHAAY